MKIFGKNDIESSQIQEKKGQGKYKFSKKEGGTMTNKNILLFMFLIILGMFGLRIMEARRASTLLPVPKPGTYTVAELFSLINQNNPAKTSEFIVPLTGKSPNYTVIKAGDDITKITGSAGTSKRGLTGIISQATMNKTTVTLRPDITLINFLFSAKQKRLDSASKAGYQKILLYFELGGFRFYLVDPFPGKIVTLKGTKRSPAMNNIKKWDLTETYVRIPGA